MLRRIIVLSFAAAAAALVGAAPAASRPQYDDAALRRMLAAQPDHSANKTTLMFARDHAFGGKSRVARLGRRSAEDNGYAVFLREAGKPTVKVYRDRKQYAELPPEKEPDFAFGPEALAARADVTFKFLGREKVGEYDTLKVEAVYPVGNLKEWRVIFYPAPGLKNLVVREEYFAGEYPVTMSFLEDVSLEVSEELFVVPGDYTKVFEKAPPDDPASELLEILRKPGDRDKRRSKPRRD